MLVKLTPDDIGKYWQDISRMIEDYLPPIASLEVDRMSNILTALLAGEMDAWAMLRVVNNRKRYVGIALTMFTGDKISGCRNLLIYCLCSYNYNPDKLWREHFEQLAKYARDSGCTRIVGYTESDRVVDLVKFLGGESRYTFISLEVGNGKLQKTQNQQLQSVS